MKRLKFLIAGFLVLWPLLTKAQTTTSWWDIAEVVSTLADNDTLVVVTAAGTTKKLPATVLKTFIDAIVAGDNVTELDGTAWRLFYVNGSGDVTELVLGANGTFLESNGASSAPGFRALEAADIPSLAATYEVQLNNEAGLYAVLSDVTRFVEENDDVTLLMGTAHRLYYTDGSGYVTALSFGSSGTVLKSNGPAAAPSWQTDATGGGSPDSAWTSIRLDTLKSSDGTAQFTFGADIETKTMLRPDLDGVRDLGSTTTFFRRVGVDTVLVDDRNTRIWRDGSGNLVLEDVVTGSKTLEDLAAGGGGNDSIFETITIGETELTEEDAIALKNRIPLDSAVTLDSDTIQRYDIVIGGAEVVDTASFHASSRYRRRINLKKDFVVTNVNVTSVGSSPGFDIQIYHNLNVGSLGTAMFDGAQSVDGTTTGVNLTDWTDNDSRIVPDGPHYITVVFSNLSGEIWQVLISFDGYLYDSGS